MFDPFDIFKSRKLYDGILWHFQCEEIICGNSAKFSLGICYGLGLYDISIKGKLRGGSFYDICKKGSYIQRFPKRES